MYPLSVNAWACHILVAVWVTGISGICITAILTYKILDDCKKNGRPDANVRRSFTMADQLLAQQHPGETWGALTASLGLVGTLVGVLYYRLNRDISAHEKKLEDGNKSFVEIGNKLVSLGEKISNLQSADSFSDIELDRIDSDIKDLTRRLTVLETEHKHCKENK